MRKCRIQEGGEKSGQFTSDFDTQRGKPESLVAKMAGTETN